MTWTPDDITDLTGRTAVVTGANGGLGLETAAALAAKGAHVVMAARNLAKAATAESEILARHPEASLEIVELDLANQDSVQRAAADISARHPKVDLLINNAGLMAMPERTTDDGYEMQFGVNHLGHWTFTAGLMGSILAADAARVVTVSSTAHHIGKVVNVDNPFMKGNYGAWRMYGQAKLANLHFAIGLNDMFEKAGVTARSLAAHPGLTNSDLQSHTVAEGGGGILGAVSHFLSSKTGMSSKDGARSQLRAATDPGAKGGQFYGPLMVNNGPPVLKPLLRRFDLAKGIDRLWEVSQRETGVALEVPNA